MPVQNIDDDDGGGGDNNDNNNASSSIGWRAWSGLIWLGIGKSDELGGQHYTSAA